MKLLTCLLLALIFASCGNSEKEKNIDTGEPVGEITWKAWQESAAWESYEPDEYKPDSARLRQINKLAKTDGLQFIMFGAAWCHDSEIGMPIFYEIVSAAPIPAHKVTLYGVDEEKEDGRGIALSHNLEKVPTLIILKNGNEIGRITEAPELSWEQDILNILNKIRRDSI